MKREYEPAEGPNTKSLLSLPPAEGCEKRPQKKRTGDQRNCSEVSGTQGVSAPTLSSSEAPRIAEIRFASRRYPNPFLPDNPSGPLSKFRTVARPHLFAEMVMCPDLTMPLPDLAVNGTKVPHFCAAAA